MRRPRKPPASPPKAQARRIAYHHGLTIQTECKSVVMTVLSLVKLPMTPMEIYWLAVGLGLTTRHHGSIAVACTQLEQQGHIIAVPNNFGEGPGGLPAARLIMTEQHATAEPDPAIYLKVVTPPPYPENRRRMSVISLRDRNASDEDRQVHCRYLGRAARALFAMIERREYA